jgi:hypothetical protein
MLRRRSLTFVFLASVSVFVVALPWVRWALSTALTIRSEEQILLTHASILLFCMGAVCVPAKLWTLGPLNRRWITYSLRTGITQKRLHLLCLVLLCAWMLRIYRLLSYGIMFSGSADVVAIAGQSYYFVVSMSLSQMLVFGAYFYLAIHSAKQPFIIWPLIGAEICWALISGGRREVIFSLAVLLFVKIFSARRVDFRPLFLSVVMLYALINIVSPVFLISRFNVLAYMTTESAVPALVMGVGDAVREIWSGDQSSAVVLSDNLADRGDVGSFLSSVISASNGAGNFMHGDAIGTAFAWAVPSAVLAKPGLMVEQYIQAKLGLPLVDDAVSWISVAYADFGLVGCFFYGGAFVVILISLVSFARKSKSEFLYVVGTMQACYIAYNVEADPLILFCAIRDFTILVVLNRLSGFIRSLPAARRY